MTNMRRGFTMIELIFVIVIIGILAAVAIPKLAATRDDAKTSKSVANLKICINDAGAAYTAREDMDINGSAACIQVQKEGCFLLTEDNNISLLVDSNGSNTETWCSGPGAAQEYALELNLTDANHTFGGTQVVR